MKLIYRGAEADILLGEWVGEKAVYKLRKPLPYRLEALDRAIRMQRTSHEAQMVNDAKLAGVNTPYLYCVNLKMALIVMQYIEGKRLKNILDRSTEDEVVAISHKFGEEIGKLHQAGIMHGDLTTSNTIICNEDLVFIDFGLSIHSFKLEDHAVDLRLIKEALNGAHSRISSSAFSSLMEGYGELVGGAKLVAIKKKLVEIERRGRYAKIE
jgi:TP53 regulating kinase-like protein